MGRTMDFEAWLAQVPGAVKRSPLWQTQYYRLALYLYDLVWSDSEAMLRDVRGRDLARQMVRSSGSLCANVEEAYGRGIGSADGLRVLRIALGEARELQGWYLRARYLLGDEVMEHRIAIVERVIVMLSRAINAHPARRKRS